MKIWKLKFELDKYDNLVPVLVEKNNLTGFKFELVWDSEQNEQH